MLNSCRLGDDEGDGGTEDGIYSHNQCHELGLRIKYQSPFVGMHQVPSEEAEVKEPREVYGVQLRVKQVK